MKDRSGTKQELIKEISALKQRIQALEQSESERKRVEEALRNHGHLVPKHFMHRNFLVRIICR